MTSPQPRSYHLSVPGELNSSYDYTKIITVSGEKNKLEQQKLLAQDIEQTRQEHSLINAQIKVSD